MTSPFENQEGYSLPIIPSSLRIGCQEWPVVQSSIAIEGSEGLCHFNRHMIQIEQSLDDTSKEVTFCHEGFYHLAAHFAGLDENKRYTIEELATACDQTLHSLLKQNGFWPQ